MKDYFIILLSELMVIPAGFLCLAPMKNQLKYSYKRILLRMAFLMLLLLPTGAFLNYMFELPPNVSLGPMVLIAFFAYRSCVTTSFAKAAAVFSFVLVFMSVGSNMANFVDAVYNPESGANSFSLAFGLSSLGFSIVICLSLFHLLRKYASFLIDHMNENPIWWITVVISMIFLTMELFIVPLKYETLYVNRIISVFLMLNALAFSMELLLGTIFYHIVKSLLNLADLRVRNSILEMQEKAFLKQQRYIEENARIRHDFKHTLRSILMMAENKDMEGISSFLEEYVKTIPEKEIINYSANNALNAVLNYYATDAANRKIDVTFRIEEPDPEKLPLSGTELCSMIGNMLENAVSAAAAQDSDNRYISLSTRIVNGNEFYITVINSFDGQTKMKNGHYLTTKKSGSGIGLRSITSTAELHRGMANFHHEGNEFYSDIVIPLKQ